MNGGVRAHSCATQIAIGSKDPHALKIPARRAEYSLRENVASPFQAEPAQLHRRQPDGTLTSIEVAASFLIGGLIMAMPIILLKMKGLPYFLQDAALDTRRK